MASNGKLIAVVGATGQQGGAVLRALKARGEFTVRALTRNPAKHRGLADEVVAADLDRPETLTTAFEGAHGDFLVTHFWEKGTDELKEVLLNVLENARHGGARTVRVAIERNPSDDAGTYVAIVVRDDGRGIAAEVMPRIFEPHFSTRTSGSGLGLAISRQIVDGWGGDIAVESEIGEGTAVTIRLRGTSSALS